MALRDLVRPRVHGSEEASDVRSGTTGGLIAAGTGGLIVVYIGCAVCYAALVASIAEMVKFSLVRYLSTQLTAMFSGIHGAHSWYNPRFENEQKITKLKH
jgi:hypothetical protein